MPNLDAATRRITWRKNQFHGASMQLLAQLFVSGIIAGSTYALLGVSFGIIYATTRIFHIANAATYVLGAYAVVGTIDSFHWSLAMAVVAGVAVATMAGVLIELLAYRPMRRRGGTLMTIFLVSLGVEIVVGSLVQIVFGPEGIPAPGFPVTILTFQTVTVTNRDILSVMACWLCIGLVLSFLRVSRYGRAVTAVQTNEILARSVGIDPGRIYLLVFAVGSALCGVAAGLFMLSGVAQPSMGMSPILMSFIAVFLGGVPSIAGAALGGLLVGVVGSLTGFFFTGDAGEIVVFAVLFLFLFLRPQGLLGQKR